MTDAAVSIPAVDLDRGAGMLERYSHDLSGSVPGYSLSLRQLAKDMRRTASRPDVELVEYRPCGRQEEGA